MSNIQSRVPRNPASRTLSELQNGVFIFYSSRSDLILRNRLKIRYKSLNLNKGH